MWYSWPKGLLRSEVPRTVVSLAKVLRAEVPQIEVPQAEVPRAEVPRAEVLRAEVSRTDVSRADVVLRAEVPRADNESVSQDLMQIEELVVQPAEQKVFLELRFEVRLYVKYLVERSVMVHLII